MASRPIYIKSPVYNLLNLKYLVVNSDQRFDIPGYYEVYNDGDLSILKNEYVKSRVYLPRHIKIVDDEYFVRFMCPKDPIKSLLNIGRNTLL
jgi:hypothetical protein